MSPKTQEYQSIEKFVFVVTYGRSGSTLLQNLLNSLDGACVRGENGNALMPLAKAWDRVRMTPNLRKMARRKQVSTPAIPWFGGETINPKQYGLALAKVFTEQILTPPPGTRISGFKEIRWTHEPLTFDITMDFARICFPNAHFVFNTRDHTEVSRSGWWVDTPEEKVFQTLERAEASYDAYLEKHPKCGIRLHYNDYVQDQDALRPLYTFLDEPFEPDRIARVMEQKLTHLKMEE